MSVGAREEQIEMVPMGGVNLGPRTLGILAGRIPNASLNLVPGRHLFLLTQPDQMAARVNAFLDAP